MPRRQAGRPIFPGTNPATGQDGVRPNPPTGSPRIVPHRCQLQLGSIRFVESGLDWGRSTAGCELENPRSTGCNGPGPSTR